MQLIGRTAFRDATSDGAQSPGLAPEPIVNLEGLTFPGVKAEPAALPLVERGRRLADALRRKGKEPGTKVWSGAEPRIGVALGGGSARGLTHIPYIEALDELGLKPAVIAGTSIGALIGAGWAAGMTGAELREHSYGVLGTTRTIMGRLWATHVPRFAGILHNGIPLQLDAARVVDSFVPDSFPADFSELSIPLYAVATDFQSWHQVVFNSGALRPAIAASIAIPTLFKPVRYAGHLLVDGSVVNPLPLDQAAADTDILIGIDVNGDAAEQPRQDYRPLDVWFGSAQIMMHQLIANAMAAYPPDVYVRPHLSLFGAHEFWRVREIIAHVDADKDRFKRQVEASIEAFIASRQRNLSGAAGSAVRLHRR
ncbi:patatin-like phospholipase family protein [Paradevosia shaoguanensis]|uniref:patatin-like phospholipase family protein n=1 Tax=Paradevosia shaoguanensis TaxID=1335043 RepID=UPI0019338995|nr:patatin-like phospholipase family protein [Paradevosia shaoguanensis]